MPFVIPAGFAHVAVEMRMTGDPQPWYCTFGVDLPIGINSPLDQANGIHYAWTITLGSLQSSLMTINTVVLKIGQTDGPPTMAYSDRGAFTGAAAHNMLPQNCALLVDKLTALGGRRNRGRMYVPGILQEGHVDHIGGIDTNHYTELTTAVNTFFLYISEGIEAGTDPLVEPEVDATPMVILHHDTVTPIAPTPVTSLRVQQVISTQRKRLR